MPQNLVSAVRQIFCFPNYRYNKKKGIVNTSTISGSKQETLQYPKVESGSAVSSSTCTVNSPDVYAFYDNINNPHSAVVQDVNRSRYDKHNSVYVYDAECDMIKRYSTPPVTNPQLLIPRTATVNTSTSCSENRSASHYVASTPQASRNSFSSVSRLQALSYDDVAAAEPPRMVTPRPRSSYDQPLTKFSPRRRDLLRTPSSWTLRSISQPLSRPLHSDSHRHIPASTISDEECSRNWSQEQEINEKGYAIVKREVSANNYEKNPRLRAGSIRSNSIRSTRSHRFAPSPGVATPTRNCFTPQPIGIGKVISGQTLPLDTFVPYHPVEARWNELNRKPSNNNNNEIHPKFDCNLKPISKNTRRNESGAVELPFLAEDIALPTTSPKRDKPHLLTNAHQAIDDTANTSFLPSGPSGHKAHKPDGVKAQSIGNTVWPETFRHSMNSMPNPGIHFGTVTSNTPSSYNSPARHSLRASFYSDYDYLTAHQFSALINGLEAGNHSEGTPF
ncbi:hypothetical protein HYFRA_00002973 [Hymenoscyphus fraxineus]|uniref:Uncharacterized protein n=1 Tax=Hymenoscyphus fraxineus TaxID=746836 RepID=A0A9N9KRF0_9HELO|nr:hypothetical protein HYFRA_00002973 [Hymenoscyphus fraxineus]